MANYKVTDTELTGIADAIRTKGGTQTQLEFPTGFVTAIENIPTGGADIEPLSVTQNGTYTAPTGKAYSPVMVNVSGSSDPAVPSEYQEVEYLQCTDYQGVQLDIPVQSKLICLDISQDAVSSSESGFAGYYYSSSAIVEMYFKNGKISAYSKGPTIDSILISNVLSDERHRVAYVFLTDVQAFIIGHYRSNNYPFAGKLYRAEISDPNGGTSLHIILKPCYRKSDNKPGMYDVVNNVFYTNIGTDEFGVGPDVN